MLCLTLKLYHHVMIGNTKVVVTRIWDKYNYRVSCGNRDYQITDEKKVEILPEVYLTAGLIYDNPWEGKQVKLNIEAPLDIQIDRGDVRSAKLRKQQQEKVGYSV